MKRMLVFHPKTTSKPNISAHFVIISIETENNSSLPAMIKSNRVMMIWLAAPTQRNESLSEYVLTIEYTAKLEILILRLFLSFDKSVLATFK